jgi:hypothetical protein
MPTRYIFYDEYGNRLGDHIEPTTAERVIGTVIFFSVMFAFMKSVLEAIAEFIRYCIENPRFAAVFFGIGIPIGLYFTRKYPGAILFEYPAWLLLILGIVMCLVGTLSHRFLFPILATMTMATVVLNFYYWFGGAQWPVTDGFLSKPFFVFAIAGTICGIIAWFAPRFISFFLGGLSAAYFTVVFALGGQGELSNLFGNVYIFLYPLFIMAFLVGGILSVILYKKANVGITALIGASFVGMALQLQPVWWVMLFVISVLIQLGIDYRFKLNRASMAQLAG